MNPLSEEKEIVVVDEKEEETETTVIRGSGRPKLLRTGQCGRPRKIFEKEINTVEFGMMCKIPMRQKLSESEAGNW